MGAVYSKVLDERMAAIGLAYTRFLDYWAVLAPTRWKSLAAIRLVNETLAELKVEQHATRRSSVGSAGVLTSWGYLFSPAGLEVAPRAVERCVSRLYEHGADLVRIGAHVRRWQRWAWSGLGEGECESGRVRHELHGPVTRSLLPDTAGPPSAGACFWRTARGLRMMPPLPSPTARWLPVRELRKR